MEKEKPWYRYNGDGDSTRGHRYPWESDIKKRKYPVDEYFLFFILLITGINTLYLNKKPTKRQERGKTILENIHDNSDFYVVYPELKKIKVYTAKGEGEIYGIKISEPFLIAMSISL